jgi:dihydrolipoamide dehydrogenase
MVSPQASELIDEGTLALEMGATLEDLLVTIHPHLTPEEIVFSVDKHSLVLDLKVYKITTD